MKKQFHFVTTIHKDVAERLSMINPSLAAEARKVLDLNKSERHIRGGLATKEKYLHMDMSIQNGTRSLCTRNRRLKPSPGEWKAHPDTEILKDPDSVFILSINTV
jgi:hypothetical protein